ncbi:unnamed protein product [marine sediment metagenome]|uniref:Uncharacterized protein n=1 Tax=marine sediment metagenome TaxID=412755 RepID=X1SE26_9ZZZZ
MIQSVKVKNVGIFLATFTLILGINLGVLNSGFPLLSFAQETGETGETGETVETEDAQETPATEKAVGAEEIEQTEGEAGGKKLVILLKK